VPTFRVALAGATLAALAVPLVPSAAHATAVSPNLVYAADVDRDGLSGLYRASAADPTNKTAILPDNGTVHVVKALLSPDGTRVAVLADFNAASATDTGASSLVTMNLDGSNRHTLATEAFTQTAVKFVDGFAWDGNSQIIYGWLQASSASFSEALQVVSQAGGTTTAFPGGANMGQPAVSADGSQIAAILYSGGTSTLYVFPSSSAATKQSLASESTTFLLEPAWSPDGANIAFVRDESDDNFDASQIDVVHFDSGTTTWGTPTTAVPAVKGSSSAWFDEDPTWTDNSTLLFDRVDDSSDTALATPSGVLPIDLWTTTNSGTWSTPANFTNTSGVDEWSPSEGPIDVTAPTAVSFVPFTLNGTSVTVRWTTPDADYSHVTLHRTDTTAGTPPVDIPNVFGTSYVDTNLVVGHTYSYNADTFDGAGNQTGVAGEWAVTATYAAKIVAVTPTSIKYHSLPFRVTWGVANQPSGTTYDVDYAVKGGSSWALGSGFHLATATTATSAAFTKGTAGQTYYFRATVHDQHGNSSTTPWSGVNVPLDQKAGSFSSGWTTISNSKVYWLGTIAATSTNGKTFTISPTAKSVSLIGTKCASCGKFAVYVDGKYRGTFSSASSTLKFRQPLWSTSFIKISKHTIKVVAVLAAHQTLQIDGVADPR
jgi:hypothetical protein